MKNFVQPSGVVPLTAPSGGVVAGSGYLIGNLFVVAQMSAAQTARFTACTSGVFTLPKNTSQAMAEGAAVYWDDTAKNLTTTVSTNKKVGQAVSVGGKLAADTTVDVLVVPN